MTARFVTIGAYGFTAVTFFEALQQAGVDTFCDIRQRRGVRGSDYAFANSRRLQARLAEIGIRYIYVQNLAPTSAVRQKQHEADNTSGVSKRQRLTLSQEFIAAYEEEILNAFDLQAFLESLGDGARVVALFCVERDPAACHRSLVAEKLRAVSGLEVVHLLPDASSSDAST